MPTPLRAGLVLLVLSSPALAQSVSLSFNGAGTNFTQLPFNQSSCNGNDGYVVTWTSQNLNSANACGNLQIFLTNSSSCPNGPPATANVDGGALTPDIVIGTVDINTLSGGSGTLTNQRRRDMPGLGGNCPDGQDITNAICAFLQYRASGSTNCDGTITSSTNLTLRYDAKPPVPPGMTLLAQDSKIVVELDPQGETLLRYEIQYAQATDADAGPSWISAGSLDATKSSMSITGLTNDVPYLVRAQSIDVVENASGFNTPQSATPEASNGFWGEYKAAGGHELGGCNVADAAVPSVFGALGVLVALIRRRR
ncbi:MAG TPA: MXAN_2561 family MXYO-CTERM-anchored protein [Myxococcaceae bacterium]|nr:MXAN_2561 family MXYO-CTERM-anchored protein [Myxococcaceae bacterium]